MGMYGLLPCTLLTSVFGSLTVCMYVCVRACACACRCVCMCMCVHVHVHAHVCVQALSLYLLKYGACSNLLPPLAE